VAGAGRSFACTLAIVSVLFCACSTAKMTGHKALLGSPESDAMLIVGSRPIGWTMDKTFDVDEHFMLLPVSCQVDAVGQGEGHTVAPLGTGHTPDRERFGELCVFVFPSLKPGPYHISQISGEYTSGSPQGNENPSSRERSNAVTYVFPPTDFPELQVELAPGEVRFLGIMGLATKHSGGDFSFSETIHRQAKDTAWCLDTGDEALVVRGILDVDPDCPWAEKLHARLRELVDTKVWLLPDRR